jgi:hypothetical protein
MGRCPFAPRHAAGAKCTPIVLVMFSILSYELDMAPLYRQAALRAAARRDRHKSRQPRSTSGSPPTPRSPSMPTAGAVAARNQMLPAAMSRSSGSHSTTAGSDLKTYRRSRPPSRSIPRAGSSRATIHPTSRSTARSIPIAAASMAASIATRAPLTPILACHPASTLNRSCLPSRTRRACSNANCPSRTMRRA